jgi:hypothetical protein
VVNPALDEICSDDRRVEGRPGPEVVLERGALAAVGIGRDEVEARKVEETARGARLGGSVSCDPNAYRRERG